MTETRETLMLIERLQKLEDECGFVFVNAAGALCDDRDDTHARVSRMREALSNARSQICQLAADLAACRAQLAAVRNWTREKQKKSLADIHDPFLNGEYRERHACQKEVAALLTPPPVPGKGNNILDGVSVSGASSNRASGPVQASDSSSESPADDPPIDCASCLKFGNSSSESGAK